MRFLMLNWRDPRNPLAGGAERVSLAYLAELARRGHEVFWFANDFPGAAREETIQSVRVIRGGGIGTSVYRAFRWYRKQPRFDLVIDQHHGIPWFAPWLCGTNCIAYIHEVLGPIWRVFYSWPLSAFGQWQERWIHWLYRNVPFWTVSQSTRTGLEAHGVRQVTVLLNGTDTVALPELEEKPLTPPYRLVVVSRLAANKRVEHVIEVLRLLGERGIDARLTVVGGGESEPGLRRLAADSGLGEKTLFTGQLPEKEKNEQMRQAHFLVHTSVREGWGLNVIEANAMGTPAAVYPVGGLVDSTLAGETGLVSPAETPDSLATALAAALQDSTQYQRWRRQAWERAKSLHWDLQLRKTCDWLELQARASRKG